MRNIKKFENVSGIDGICARAMLKELRSIFLYWRSYKDEKLGVLMVNLDSEEGFDVEFTIDPGEYPLKERNYQIWRVTRESRERIGTLEQGEDLQLAVHLPPRKIVLVEFLPKIG